MCLQCTVGKQSRVLTVANKQSPVFVSFIKKMLLIIVIIFAVFLPLCLFFSQYNTPKTKNKPTNKQPQQLSTMERMPKHYTDAAGSDFKLMTHLYDDATTILESIERGCSLNGNGDIG